MRLLVVLLVVWWSAAFCLPARAQDSTDSATPAARSAKPPSKKRAAKHSSTSKRSKRSKNSRKKKRAASPRRLRRVHRAFVASSDLKPMAKQLLDDRTPAAYAGVETYARRHAGDDAGSLANLALGYAHILDHQPDKAIPPLLKARAHADELSDYVSYWLGSAYAATGDSQQALDTLRDFAAHYPDSVFERDAALVYANALTATGQAKDALALLEKYQEPARSDVYLALGRTLLKLGDQARAVAFLQRLYLTMPLSAEADQAGDLLQTLAGTAAPTAAQLRIRANLLAQGKRYHDAESEYRRLLASAAAADRPPLTVALAGTLHRDGDDRQARQMLEPLEISGEANAERLFYLLEIARSDGDDDRFLHALDDLRSAGTGTRWLERGLLAAGNLYLVRNDYDRALDFYRELAQRFPQGSVAPYANWKVAWLSLRQGRDDEAKRGLEDQIARYPASAQVPAALYWRARLAEEDNDPVKASRYYRKLVDRFPNYYYADLARERLLKLEAAPGTVRRTASADDPPDAVLEKLPPLPQSAKYVEERPPDDDLRVQKALLLENGGLIDFAIRELKAAQQEDGGSWATAEMARLYWDDGAYYRALRLLKSSVPSYLSSTLDALPRDYWEFLFPRPYWNELKRYAAANGLSPYLVASLIRQESEFNPGAVSSANAYGLMQLLPGNGRKMARELRLRYSTDALLTPTLNLALGTRFFRQMLDHFNGNVEYALAAYNAGSDRVDAWLAAGKYRDTQEFVESIPFTETREYVQSILRNVSVYRRLYGQP